MSRKELLPALAWRVDALLDPLLRRARWLADRGRGRAASVLLELDWRLGDEVMALPCFEALKRRWPRLRLAARMRYPELALANPWLDLVNPQRLHAHRWLCLREEQPGVSRRELLGRRIGVSLDGLEPRIYLQAEEVEQVVHPLLREGREPRLLVHPRSSQGCKSWPRERWQQLCERLTRRGCRVLEVGSGRPRLEGFETLNGRTGVRELARAAAQADLLLGEDSGPLHVALAVGTPAVGVFGATRAEWLYPPAAPLGVVEAGSECRHCWSRWRLAWPDGHCPLERHECMESISVEAVEAAVLERLG